MTAKHNNTLYNNINSLGYFLTAFVFLFALVGWLPILICFSSEDYAIDWSGGWIERWAFLELIFFSAALVLITVLGTFSIDLSRLPEGWHFLWAFSFWPIGSSRIRFGREQETNAQLLTLDEDFFMNDDDDDLPRDIDKPAGYTSGRPRTTVPVRLTLSELIPTFIGTKLEGLRQRFSQREITHYVATLDKQREAHNALKNYIESETELIQSHTGRKYAESRAWRKNELEIKRDEREAAEIDRDIESIKNPRRPQSTESDFENFAEDLLRTGAAGPHERIAMAKIAEMIKEVGGEDKVTDELRERFDLLLKEAKKRDEKR